MHTIRTSTEVDAPAEAVWAVIRDFASYGEWNPFVVGISGDQRVGAALDVHISVDGKTRHFRPHVVEWRPQTSLRWLGKAFAGWVFRAEHGLAVEPMPGGRARFVHDEVFRGVAVPLVPRLLRKTEEAFRAMDSALKQRVEAMVHAHRH